MTVLAATGHSEAAVTRVDATVDEVAFQILRENPVAHMRPVVLKNHVGKNHVKKTLEVVVKGFVLKSH